MQLAICWPQASQVSLEGFKCQDHPQYHKVEAVIRPLIRSTLGGLGAWIRPRGIGWHMLKALCKLSPLRVGRNVAVPDRSPLDIEAFSAKMFCFSFSAAPACWQLRVLFWDRCVEAHVNRCQGEESSCLSQVDRRQNDMPRQKRSFAER